MRKDHRPYLLKEALGAVYALYARVYLHPQFERVGEGTHFISPRHFEVWGPHVCVGNDVHLMATADKHVRFTAWPGPDFCGRIEIGDYCIVLPGTRISSAASVTIGNSCMLAHNVYITDADWHGVYDRNEAPGKSAPVVLADNVWLADSSIVCKGVQIGENSVIGAGSVVVHDIPANCIAAGNPARVVRELEPDRRVKRRGDLFQGEVPYARYLQEFDRYVLKDNTLRRWLRSKLLPTREL